MRIFYAETGETWRKEEKLEFLRKAETVYGVEWTELTPDARHTWLTDGLFPEFEKFLPLATKEGKTSKKKTFKVFSSFLVLGSQLIEMPMFIHSIWMI